jgi:hypothetical protein
MMTASRPFARIGPMTWLFLQGVATVVSILLAFGIDAWWDERKAVAEKNVMLKSVKAELLSDLKWIDGECAYRQASLNNVMALLKAAAAGRYEDAGTTLDQRLADIMWNTYSGLSLGAVNSLLSSGRDADIVDVKLRTWLHAYPIRVEWFRLNGAQDQAVVLEITVPFLSKNANLLQINNEANRRGIPGSGNWADSTLTVPLAETDDHAPLLGNRGFREVLVRKQWIDAGQLRDLCGYMATDLKDNVRLIDRELADAT